MASPSNNTVKPSTRRRVPVQTMPPAPALVSASLSAAPASDTILLGAGLVVFIGFLMALTAFRFVYHEWPGDAVNASPPGEASHAYSPWRVKKKTSVMVDPNAALVKRLVALPDAWAAEVQRDPALKSRFGNSTWTLLTVDQILRPGQTIGLNVVASDSVISPDAAKRLRDTLASRLTYYDMPSGWKYLLVPSIYMEKPDSVLLKDAQKQPAFRGMIPVRVTLHVDGYALTNRGLVSVFTDHALPEEYLLPFNPDMDAFSLTARR